MSSTIFRVQDKHGRGPWRPGFSRLWVIPRKDHDNLPPWTEEFPHLYLDRLKQVHFGAGCRTIKQLRRWFNRREYKTLLGFGYCVVMMDVEEILAESEIQLVFSRGIPLDQKISGVRIY